MNKSELSANIIEFLEKDSTQNFLIIANNFINLLESETFNEEILLSKIHPTVIDLYTAGFKLT